MRAVMLLLVVGCGSSARAPADAASATPDGAPDDRAADAVAPDASTDVVTAAQVIDAICMRLAPCCAVVSLPSDGSACRASLASGSGYQPALAEPCLTSLRLAGAAACTSELPPACTWVFTSGVATRDLGEPCTQDEQCVLSSLGPVVCAGAGQTAGYCQVRVRGRAGEAPCVGTQSGPLIVPARDPAPGPKGYLCAVADGVWCDDTTHACAPTKTAGAACTSFGECGAAFTCDDASSTCVPRKHQGDACTVDEECPSTVCAEDNKCAPPASISAGVRSLCGMP